MIPNEKAPWPTLPPIANAPNITAPRSSATGIYQRLRVNSRVCIEHLFYGLFEVASERDRQRQ